MTVTRADFLMHGRLDNFRARLTTLLVELDTLIRGQMEAASQEKLGGGGTISYGTIPPTWNLAWKSHGRPYDATLMAFQQGEIGRASCREGGGRGGGVGAVVEVVG